MDSAGNEMLHNPAARHKERHASAAVWHDGARGGAARRSLSRHSHS